MADRPWIIESVRGTFFPATMARPKMRDWWPLVAELDYPALQISENSQGYGSAQSPIEASTAVLTLVCQPGRFDWHYGFAIDPASPYLGLTGGTPAVPILRNFVRRLGRWMSTAPACNRVALGSVCRMVVGDREEGYIALQTLLPAVTIDPQGSRDFLYRVNRPRRSKSMGEGLELNRLGEWGVANLTLTPQIVQPGLVIGAPMHGSSPPVLAMPFVSGQFVRAALDMNTTADTDRIFSSTELASVSEELLELTIESMEQGDRP